MAIVRSGANQGLSAVGGKAGLKAAAKKHALKKHAAEKRAGKKAARSRSPKAAVRSISDAKPPLDDHHAELEMAFHHLQRAGAIISLLEPDSGGDLRALLEHGIELYRHALGEKRQKSRSVQCASGLLRATEHLGMAGLYSARREHRVDVEAPTLVQVKHHLDTLDERLDGVKPKKEGRRLVEMARELLRQAMNTGSDHHLRYELVMAADGICSALEAGL